MDFPLQILSDELIYSLGWTVIHSLWQGALIALVLALILPQLQKQTSRLRYEVTLGALFLTLLCSLCTFILLLDQASGIIGTPSSTLSFYDTVVVQTTGPQSLWQQVSLQMATYFEEHLPLIVTAWLMGMLFFLLRTLGGYAYVQHLRYHHNQELGKPWQQKMKHLQLRLGIARPVKLMESALAKAPMVIGHFKPVILMPLGAVNHLTTNEVEAVLAHELAHISRNDYLMNFFISFVEILFYYHPGIWWMAAYVRAERENCCDDAAISLCGNSLTYAKALVSLQQFHHQVPSFAMPFSGKKYHLLNRVKRILNQPQNRTNVMEKLMATTMMLFLLLCLSASSGLPSETSEQPEKEVIEVRLQKIKPAKSVVDGIAVQTDTIPGKKHRRIYRKMSGDRSIEVVMEGEEIKSLTIDGEQIPESEFKNKEGLVKEVLAKIRELPVPPTPPTPPTPPVAPAPPANPAAPTAPTPPAPPAAPHPPAPSAPPAPSIKWKGLGKISSTTTKTVTTNTDEEGNTRIFITTDNDEEPMEILIEEGDQIIFIDGNEIMSGDSVIIIEELEIPGFGAGNFKFFNDSDFRFEVEKNAPLALYQGQELVFPDHPELLAKLELNRETLAKIRKEQSKAFQEQAEAYRLKSQAEKDKIQKYRIRLKADREAQRARILKEVEAQREHQRQLEKEQRASLEKRRAEHRVYVENLRKKEQQYHLLHKRTGDNKLLSTFREALLKDGLIKPEEPYGFELSDNKLKINGKKQSEELHQKYLQLYEQVTGDKFGKGEVKIKQNDSCTSTSVSSKKD